MDIDIFNTFKSKSFFSTSLYLSGEEFESKSYGNDVERYSLAKDDDDVDSKFDFLQDNFGVTSLNDINIFDLDKNAFFSLKEENYKEMYFLNSKRDRENIAIEKDNNVKIKKGEINPIENKIDNKEEQFSYENYGCNGNKIENKKKVIEKKEEGESQKNKKQELNDREMKNLKENEKKKMFKIEKVKKEDKEKNTQYGRKKQEDKDKGKNGDHNRDSEDNKMRKIKSFFGKHLYIFIRESFKDKYEFLKLEISINKNLKKNFNENLFKMKIKDIYFNFKISEKYVHFSEDINKKLINKIYEEQKETAVIKILNLTYIEAFDIFRRKIMGKDISPELKNKIKGTDFLDTNRFKDFDCLIEKIREEEKKNSNGDIEEYINDIKRLCIHFEGWFGQKIGRTRKDTADKTE
jgi:hypothetical protein